jgi:tetratricopeptide (TPR) repeat protein
MKNIVYLLLFITSVLTAQNGFETGNALYKKGQYEQAIQAYQSVVQTENRPICISIWVIVITSSIR